MTRGRLATRLASLEQRIGPQGRWDVDMDALERQVAAETGLSVEEVRRQADLEGDPSGVGSRIAVRLLEGWSRSGITFDRIMAEAHRSIDAEGSSADTAPV